MLRKTVFSKAHALGAALLFFTVFSAQAALLGRAAATPGSDDYQAYYDTELGITWLTDANYAKTSGYDADGLLSYTDAVAFIDSVNSTGLLGSSVWRLPNADRDGPGNGRVVDCTTEWTEEECKNNEALYLQIYNTGYGAVFLTDVPDNPIIGEQFMWTSTLTNEPGDQRAWFWELGTGLGAFSTLPLDFELGVWLVADGDIGATVVPLPAAVWLFGSALAGLGWLRRPQ